MPKQKSLKSFSYKLLKAVALSGVVIVAASSPFFGMRASGAFKKELYKKKWKEFYRSLYFLRFKKRLNVAQNNDGTYTLEITQHGQNTIEKYELGNLKIEKPDQWDGGWRVISFDIPSNKSKKVARQALLNKLKELGFIMLQKSIWIHPFECFKEIAIIAKAFRVEPYVYSFTAYDFEGNKEYKLKKDFEARNGIKLK